MHIQAQAQPIYAKRFMVGKGRHSVSLNLMISVLTHLSRSCLSDTSFSLTCCILGVIVYPFSLKSRVGLFYPGGKVFKTQEVNNSQLSVSS